MTSLPPGIESPFKVGGSPLFKTVGNEAVAAPPINSATGMSPFSVAGATPTNAPLTVGDVIHQLPPEMVRAGAVPAEQPLSLPPVLLENALRSGQAALPVFELYRVCPALFQVPVSPQDPRLVPLPAVKLPGLVAKALEGQQAGDMANAPVQPSSPAASPFAMAQPASAAAAAAPFQMAAASQAPGPPVIASGFPMSPFAAAAPAFATPGQTSAPAVSAQPHKPVAELSAASPFAIKQDIPSANPFAVAAPPQEASPPVSSQSPFAVTGSPFGMPAAQHPAVDSSLPASAASLPAASPFAAMSPVRVPTSAEPPQTSLTGLFTPRSQESAATPPAMAQPVSPAPSVMPFAAEMKKAVVEPPFAVPPISSFAPASAPAPAVMPLSMAGSASSAHGAVKFGFAAILNGYSVEELGFNPTMVPAWITTNVPSSTLNEQIASGAVVVELGALIDGLSDVGFRNTLSSAKRGFQVKLPQNDVFHALTNTPSSHASVSAPPSTAAPAGNAFVIQPGAPSGQVNRIEAGQQSALPFVAAAAPPPSQHPLSAFASPAPADPSLVQPIVSSLFAPKLGVSLNPFEQKQPEAASAPVPLFSALSTESPVPSAFAAPSIPMSAPSVFPSAVSAPPPQFPVEALVKPFGGTPPLFAPQTVEPQVFPLAPATKPFDPFAASASSSGTLQPKMQAGAGLSSAQLLGQSSSLQAPVQAPTVTQTSPLSGLFNSGAFESAKHVPQAKPAPLFAPAPEEIASVPAPATQSLFGSSSPSAAPTLQVPDSAASKVLPQPLSATPAKMASVKHSFLGLSPVDTQTDQLLLRALLGTEENLAAPRVVELLATQNGLSACVCLHGSHVLSHADSTKPAAAEFQRQAPEIARQLRALAPLIGIESAETFTLNAGGRLLTFCFPGSTTVAVLHENEPSTGLRDKITLISRELARMLT